jgi:hypothetical protein
MAAAYIVKHEYRIPASRDLGPTEVTVLARAAAAAGEDMMPDGGEPVGAAADGCGGE